MKDVTADEVIDDWHDRIAEREPPNLFRIGEGNLSRIEVGPGLVTVIGGATGCGKSALIMQWTTDALRLRPNLKACVLSVEMSPEALLERQLSRLSGIPLSDLRYRRFVDSDQERLDHAGDTLRTIANRLRFVRADYSLEHLASQADSFGAALVVIDYLQRVQASGSYTDLRSMMTAAMSRIRQIADTERAVIAVSALSRPKEPQASVGLSALRESSEIEYGADDVYMFPSARSKDDIVELKHLKGRNVELRDIRLRFDGSHMNFISA